MHFKANLPSLSRPLEALTRILRGAVLAALASSGPMALAGLEVQLESTSLLPGGLCRLSATRGGETPACTWTVQGPGSIVMHRGAPHFKAPERLAGLINTTHVLVTAHDNPEEDFAIVPIRLLPAIQFLNSQGQLTPFPALIAEDLMPEVMGYDWFAPYPQLSLFAGRVSGFDEDVPECFTGTRVIRHLPKDGAMPGLSGHWLLAGQGGVVHVVSPLGAVTPLAGAPGRVGTLAVRPTPAPEDPCPHRVVFACWPEAAPDGGWTLEVLDADGRHSRLDLWEQGDEDGAAPRPVQLASIIGLAMASDGTIHVAEHGKQLIRTVAPDGRVRILAGNPDYDGLQQNDAQGAVATFQNMQGIVLHGPSGDLYVSDSATIRRVTPAGQVSTVLGQALGNLTRNFNERVVALNDPCLQAPQDLQVHGNHLLISDAGSGTIWMFNLESRRLRVLVGRAGDAWDPEDAEEQLGPLEAYAPGVPADRCATLSEAGSIGVAADGTCLVGLRHGLAKLDWFPDKCLSHPAQLR